MRLWDLDTERQTHVLSGHQSKAGFVRIHSSIVVSSGDDNTVRIWDLGSGSALQVLEGHSGCVTHVAFSDDGKTMATGDWKGVVMVWSLDSG